MAKINHNKKLDFMHYVVLYISIAFLVSVRTLFKKKIE